VASSSVLQNQSQMILAKQKSKSKPKLMICKSQILLKTRDNNN